MRAVSAERRAPAVEDALPASLIAVVIVLAVAFLGTNLLDQVGGVGSSLEDAT